jgi:TonB family protein
MRNAARLCFVFLPVLALAQVAPQKPKIICDHAAPPAGMRWVCKSQCDCHLEGKLQNDEDDLGPTNREATERADSACRPFVTSAFAPAYPAIARANRITGTVFFELEIDERGNVERATLQQGHPTLARPALEAVKRWRFSPGCSRAQVVSVRFDLTDDEGSNPSGFQFSPPDDVVIVAPAPTVQVQTTRTRKNRQMGSKPLPPSK